MSVAVQRIFLQAIHFALRLFMPSGYAPHCSSQCQYSFASSIQDMQDAADASNLATHLWVLILSSGGACSSPPEAPYAKAAARLTIMKNLFALRSWIFHCLSQPSIFTPIRALNRTGALPQQKGRLMFCPNQGYDRPFFPR